ncbi:WG repeat-containing protein [Bacteroidales bacterium OttesenSCG-928-A17]|nr:WG repeat-containing protein [Bacteroidales bacterium OttesenSCG-928-A17]
MKKLITLLLLFVAINISAQTLKPIQDQMTDKYGFVDQRGEWAIPPQFDDHATAFGYYSFAVVRFKGKWGAINKKGDFIVKPVFETSGPPHDAATEINKNIPLGKSLWVVKDITTNKYGFVNHLGEWTILPQFDDHATAFGYYSFAVVRFKGKWGAINKKGDFIVKPVFETSGPPHDAASEIDKGTPLGKNLWSIKDITTDKYGFVNHLGNWAILPQFDDVSTAFGYYSFATVKLKGKWGAINKKGEYIVKPVFDSSTPPHEAAMKQQKSPNYVAVLPSEVANYDSKTPAPVLQQASSSSSPSSSTTAQTKSINPTSNDTNQAVTPPTIKILSPQSGSGFSTEEVVIKYEAKTFDNKTPTIHVSINGEPYNLKTKGVKRASDELTLTLPRNEEKCFIQLIAEDSRENNSKAASLTLHYTGEKLKPTLHILAIGIGNYADANISNLDHASKDALDIVNTIKTLNSDIYQKIETPILLRDSEATAVNIKRNLKSMVNRVNQDDVIVLYFSGHGAKEDNHTYFISSDAEKDDLYSTAVNFNDIRTAMNLLIDKHCKVVTFMDACHSGSLYNTKSISTTIQDIVPGVVSFYSSTSSQKSIEADKWQNGVFTKAVVEGLKGKARNKDGKITTLDLEKYVKENVHKETNGIQSPIVENPVGDFILF